LIVVGFYFSIGDVIYRGKIEEIIFEFSPPEGAPKGILVLCEGLPGVPKQKELIPFLSSKGFFVIYPRYRGTWESGGEFLKESPVKDIEEIIKFLKKGEIVELYSGKEFDVSSYGIYVVGSSFGGAVALSLASNNDVAKIVALSPVVDIETYNNENKHRDLLHLRGFVKEAFNKAFRFDDMDWEKMASGDLFNPPQQIDKKRSKDILIAYDKSDTQINFKIVQNYIVKNDIKGILTDDSGHLSFSRTPKNVWCEIIDWILE